MVVFKLTHLEQFNEIKTVKVDRHVSIFGQLNKCQQINCSAKFNTLNTN